MTHTSARTWQYLGLIVIALAMGAGYWYFSARAGVKQGAPLAGPAPSNLVGYWSFDGDDISGTTVYDRSGSGNNGTTSGSPVKIAGKLGQALSLSGGSQVQVASPSSALDILVGGKVSTAFWYYSRHGNGSNGNIYHRASGGCAQYGAVLLGGATTDAISFYYRGGDCSGVDNYQVTGITKDAWHHVVSTYDTTNGMFVVYVDGIAKLTATTIPTNNIAFGAGAQLAIGANAGSGTPYFEGTIDDIRIYNTALTASQVYDLYKLGGETVGASTPTRDSLNEGLAGYWKLDDASGTTATDSSTNGNNGTLLLGPSWTTGQIGSAVNFDGVDDEINVATTTSLNLSTEITVSAWINPSVLGTHGGIAYKSDTSWGLRTSASTLNLVINSTNHQSDTGSLTTGVWTHVVGTYDGANVKLYKNGTLIKTIAQTGAINSANGSFTIGGGGSTIYFTGPIDETRIYNRSLSAEEVTKLYKTTTPSNPDTRLKGYWSFDGDSISGTTVRDLSGAGHNGTLTNGPTTDPGIHGQALSFDGANDSVIMGTWQGPQTAFSASAWIKPRSVPTSLILSGYYSAAYMQLTVMADGSVIGRIHQAIDTIYIGRTTAAGMLTTGNWYHVSYTWDGGTTNSAIKIYINGVRADVADNGAGTFTAPYAGTFFDWNIGAQSGGGGQFFSGLIDEVRIYNAALSASEIYNLYQEGGVKVNKSQNNNGDSLNDGLAGYWKMDDASGTTATDSSGNGNNGTLTNGPTWGTGQIGGAVSFDGTDDYVATTAKITSAPFTVCQWFISWDVNRNYDISWSMMHQVGYPADGWYIQINGSGVSFNAAENETFAGVNGSTLVANQWYHICGVEASSNSRLLYVNGVLAGTNTTTIVPSGVDYMNIGEWLDHRYRFPGLIDETRLYNRALSADEVSRLYKTTSPTNPETGLVGYWSFNGKDIAGTTAYDRSGRGNNGTLTNGPTTDPGKIGQALTFDGSDDYVDITMVTPTPNLSICAWVWPTAVTAQRIIIDGQGSDQERLRLEIYGSVFRTHFGDGTSWGAIVDGATTISAGNWYFACGVRSGANTLLYLNGAQDGTGSDGISVASDTKIFIGRYSYDLTHNFVGKIDEVRIYNRVLSATEIANLYNFGR